MMNKKINNKEIENIEEKVNIKETKQIKRNVFLNGINFNYLKTLNINEISRLSDALEKC